MIEVELPDGRVLEFPDGTPQDVMRSAMQKLTSREQQPSRESYLLTIGRAAKAQHMKNLGLVTPPDEFMSAGYDRTGIGEAILQGANQGATLGFGDEAVAGILSAVTDKTYDQALGQTRASLAKSREDRPMATLAGEVAGSMIPGAGISNAAGKGATVTGQVVRAATAGAATGAAYGYGAAEGGVTERVKGAAGGAASGAVGGVVGLGAGKAIEWAARKIGPVVGRLFADSRVFDRTSGKLTEEGKATLRALGYNADEISTAFAKEFGQKIDDGIAPQAAAASAEMAEFGIPAYRANITGSADDFAALERARRGAVGQGAETKVRTALDAQDRAMREAGDDIARGFAGGVRGDQYDAAGAVSDRLRSMAASEKAAAQSLYEASDSLGMGIDARAAKGVSDRIETRLADAEVDITLGQLPETRAFMGRLSKRGMGDKPVSLSLVDGLRKDINLAMRKNIGAEDARALGIIKNEYDKWLDEVVDAGLFTGDEAALSKLKEARGLWAEYSRKFLGKDGPDRFIRQMVESEASPSEVSQWLFSAGKLGSGKLNASLAGALKSTLGEGDEWNMLRQAVFRQLTEKPEGMTQWGPQKISQNIMGFIASPATRDLARTMFGPDEIAKMGRYAGALKRMVPPPGAVNYSGTAYENARMARTMFQGLLGAIGFAQGGVGGAVVAKGGAQAAETGRNWLATKAMLSSTATAPLGPQSGPQLIGSLAGVHSSQAAQRQPR